MRLVAALLLCLSPALADAATITVGAGQAYTTITAGIAAMSAGDTLVIKDGTYSQQVTGVPSGSDGAYSIVKAEHDGGVVITGGLNLVHTDHHIQIEGVKFNSPDGKTVRGNHLKFLRCAFAGGAASGNESNVVIGTNDYSDTQYILLEDCWAYGSGGRYKIMVYNSDRVVLRRVVVRDDGGWADGGTGNPEAGIVIYQSSNVSMQNAMVIDSNLNTYAVTNTAAFYLTGHGGNRASSNAEYLGCMAINNKKWGWSVDTDDGAVGLTMQDNIIYGQESGGIAASNTSVAMTISRLTLGATGYGIGNWGSKSNTVTGAVFSALTGTLNTGSNTLTNYTAYASAPLAAAGGLRYLTRPDAGSGLATAGKGATVMYRYGVSGTLWGDTGYNTLTATPLWPWANEDRIKTDMAAAGARGFTSGTALDGSAQTLTKYVWEYLGNPIPTDVYVPTAPVVYPSLAPVQHASGGAFSAKVGYHWDSIKQEYVPVLLRSAGDGRWYPNLRLDDNSGFLTTDTGNRLVLY